MWLRRRHGRLLFFLPILLLITRLPPYPSTPRTLIIKLQGRFGNQLFQIAASEYYASQYYYAGRPDVVFLRNNFSDETDLSEGVFRNLPHVDQPPCRETRILERRHSCEPVRRLARCPLLEGFWQCPFYAQAGKGLITDTLRNSSLYDEAAANMRALVNHSENLVVVHVRRGDYIKRFNKELLEPLPISYYASAARRMPKPAVFAIFSDDPKWCKTRMTRWLSRGEDRDRLVFVEEKDNVKALIMMMQAKYFIIANSTFSWWGAFLANARVVAAPHRWFGKRVIRPERIQPPDWILV